MFRGLLIVLAFCAATEAQQRIGSQRCAQCHREIAARYAQSSMGRSMAPAASFHLEHAATVGPYQVYERDGKLYQNSFPLDYMVGSGVNGQTFLLRRLGALVEAPLTYYNREGKWDLSPGYEKQDAGFLRPVPEGCIACHSAGAPPDPNNLAVGCESCHGPGQTHAAKPSRANIVNPAKLDRRLADDICMYCHQGGDARILQPGKTYSDFKPGEPLNRTLAIFRKPATREEDLRDDDLLEHHAAIELSKCFRASGTATGQKLSCLTCHDPHTAVNYNQRCQECHASVAHAANVDGNCVGCHMPKRQVKQVSHAALTNHRIIRTPGEALPAGNRSIYFNGNIAELPQITKLAAYGELGMEQEYLRLLDSLAPSMPQDKVVRASLGRRALLMGKPSEAIGYLEGLPAIPSLLDLAQAYKALGRQAEAIEPLQQAARLEPVNATTRKGLVLAYIEAKNYTAARSEMERYVLDFPEDEFMKGLLQKVSSR